MTHATHALSTYFDTIREFMTMYEMAQGFLNKPVRNVITMANSTY